MIKYILKKRKKDKMQKKTHTKHNKTNTEIGWSMSVRLKLPTSARMEEGLPWCGVPLCGRAKPSFFGHDIFGWAAVWSPLELSGFPLKLTGCIWLFETRMAQTGVGAKPSSPRVLLNVLLQADA